MNPVKSVCNWKFINQCTNWAITTAKFFLHTPRLAKVTFANKLKSHFQDEFEKTIHNKTDQYTDTEDIQQLDLFFERYCRLWIFTLLLIIFFLSLSFVGTYQFHNCFITSLFMAISAIIAIQYILPYPQHHLKFDLFSFCFENEEKEKLLVSQKPISITSDSSETFTFSAQEILVIDYFTLLASERQNLYTRKVVNKEAISKRLAETYNLSKEYKIKSLLSRSRKDNTFKFLEYDLNKPRDAEALEKINEFLIANNNPTAQKLFRNYFYKK